MTLKSAYTFNFLLLFIFVGCQSATTITEDDINQNSNTVGAFSWNLPTGVYAPRVPSDNPMSNEKVELGRFLFYDKKLSANQTQSCESCHFQANGFADHNTVGIGSTGIHHVRNPNGLTNTAYYNSYGWADPTLTTLEHFIIKPITGSNPIELGVTDDKRAEVIARFENNTTYQTMFRAAFPDIQNPFTMENIVKAISTFSRTLNSFNSPFDKYQRGDNSALTASQIRGMNLFMSEGGECFHCHDGNHFSDSTSDSKTYQIVQFFHNIGLYNIGGDGSYPIGNQGIYETTKVILDKGRFKAPTLRNVELSAPYMHDGSMATLRDVIELHSNGGRNIASGIYAGNGINNPFKDSDIAARDFTEQDKEDLENFLKSLTDAEFVTNPKIANPFR